MQSSKRKKIKLILKIFDFLIIIIPLLLSVAFFTLVERKLMGSFQRRKGPNVVGVFGLLQALADGLKLLLKEHIFPSNADKFLFILAPLLSFSVSLSSWAVISFNKNSALIDFNLSVLYLLALSAVGVYGIIIAGWASNSKYAFLGSLRSSAQMISYEVSIGFIILSLILCTNSYNLTSIIEYQEFFFFFMPLFPIFVLFLKK